MNDKRMYTITIGSLRKYLNKHILDSDESIILVITEPVFGSKDSTFDVFNDGLNIFETMDIIKNNKEESE